MESSLKYAAFADFLPYSKNEGQLLMSLGLFFFAFNI